MKNTMPAKSSGLSLLLWTTAFLILLLFNPLTANAQITGNTPTDTLDPKVRSKTNARVRTNKPAMSLKELRNCFAEAVGCKVDQLSCDAPLTSKQFATWLMNCDYRDPDRKGNPDFNAIDFVFLDLKFPHCFADRIEKYSVWAYKGTSMDDEEGVAYSLVPKISFPSNPQYEALMNLRADMINRRNPLEVPVMKVANIVFKKMAVHGYKNERGERVAIAGEWRDYFAPRVGLK